MVVLIDTNVIIDFLVAREPFYDSALHVMEKCASGEAEGVDLEDMRIKILELVMET